MIKHEERDIYLNQEYRNQLRLRCKTFQVPSLYVDGQHIGVSTVEWSLRDSLPYQTASLGRILLSLHVGRLNGNMRIR